MSILDDIVARNRRRLPAAIRSEPLDALREKVRRSPDPADFAAALRGPDVRVIAEVKKASPSAGLLRPRMRPVSLAETYARAGAAAISVLTERYYFQGSLSHLAAIRSALDGPGRRPLLRKDFLFDPYQVYQARAYGADALLLITALLDEDALRSLLALTWDLGMEALVEVHDEEEVRRAVAAGARVVGINNRDLRTFHTDLDTTNRLRRLVPETTVLVSESGIRGRPDVDRVRSWDVDAVLVGEHLVTSRSPERALRELLGTMVSSAAPVMPGAGRGGSLSRCPEPAEEASKGRGDIERQERRGRTFPEPVEGPGGARRTRIRASASSKRHEMASP